MPPPPDSAGTTSNPDPAQRHDNRIYKLERVGPALVVQCYADGFSALTVKEKFLAYHLSLAAIAGRDIAVDQHHPEALRIRNILESIIGRPEGTAPVVLENIQRYLKLFWINNGFYDNITSRKFVPECTFRQLQDAYAGTQTSTGGGTSSGDTGNEDLDRLEEIIFSPDRDPVLTNKSPGEDWISGSAVNYYDRRLTLGEVQRWAEEGNERHPLNSKVILQAGTILEEVWRAGDDEHPTGTYGAELREVIRHLEDALPFASSPYQAGTIRKLVKFLRSGLAEDFREYNIHWVKDTSTVDFNMGFIEVYLDPRSQKGEWQSSVYMTNPGQTKIMQALAREAQYFEDRAPWSAEFRKTVSHVPIANVVDVIVQTGGTGPISPVGINLPNEQAIRQHHGSKSILLGNISDASDMAMGHEIVREFGFDEEEIECEIRFGPTADKLHTALHEVIGHGSAKMKAGLENTNPSDLLPGYYSTIEEARADCVALWFARDEKLIEIGVAEDRDSLDTIAATLFRQMFRGALTQLRQIGDHTRLEEDHMKNRQLIVRFVMENSQAVVLRKRDGKSFYRIVDFDAARDAVGALLADLTRIKSEGDIASAKKLVDTYGLDVDTKLRDEVRARAEGLNLPLYLAFVQPKLELVFDPSGAPVDVKMSYPLDISKQMLEYSAFCRH